MLNFIYSVGSHYELFLVFSLVVETLLYPRTYTKFAASTPKFSTATLKFIKNQSLTSHISINLANFFTKLQRKISAAVSQVL